MATLPLQGLLVLDFSQFLAGPSAALRLADLGATVVKVERPGTGELGRSLYISDQEFDGESALFHTINRNKKSYAANLKDPEDLTRVRKLVTRADVLIENFRPGVMQRFGLDYDSVRELNPGLVYGTVTGYGTEGPWKNLPGQDLLIQARSGLAWLSGEAEQGPVPIGLSVSDIITGAHLVQGILACLVRRGVTGEGGRVEVNLLESTLDMQFELLTCHLNDGGKQPQRSAVNNANAYLGAPYGVYQTADGHLALSMGDIPKLGEIVECPKLAQYTDNKQWFVKRDEIKAVLAKHLTSQTTQYWLDRLVPMDYWCAPVLSWSELRDEAGFQALEFVQTLTRESGAEMDTTRCPIRINCDKIYSGQAAPRPGEHTDEINTTYNLT
ncbi:CaiB/BaiF CoA transferase family protein [Oceanidesulfovibrio marinus]|uniref:CoA transferase n=1 Tax=Oceanidesulfovibrio marinus TaxID=370038 RepID=A0A6P1ZKA2_9BACT|nr:CaiB/BaiF CoA-transferase family protein [Oceanidesulfovibrio marinus]QJT07573.1 CoA transferase [Oceanidesulfovibrio marinus]TVM34513.1 CoA transferase [Oceanidesulfovibrio marinus]